MRHDLICNNVNDDHQNNCANNSNSCVHRTPESPDVTTGTEETQKCAAKHEGIQDGYSRVENQDLSESREEEDLSGEERESGKECGEGGAEDGDSDEGDCREDTFHSDGGIVGELWRREREGGREGGGEGEGGREGGTREGGRKGKVGDGRRERRKRDFVYTFLLPKIHLAKLIYKHIYTHWQKL